MDTPPSSSAKRGIVPLHVARDVGIIFLLTFLGGFVIGVASVFFRNDALKTLLIALSNMTLSTVGFVIAGCLTTRNRWLHLILVTAGLWLVSLVNVLFAPFTIIQWFFGLIFLLVAMGVGGGISCLIRSEQ